MPDVNIPASGSMGVEPPPNAPRETALALDPSMVQSQIDRARANERELKPLTFSGPGDSLDPAKTPSSGGDDEVTRRLERIKEDQRLLNAQREHNPQPAASDTDSPSRGMPKVQADPGKVITGGFGEAMEAQYFPLDGGELRQLCLHLMGELAVRIENDLRFHPAATYPRVRVSATLHVEGFGFNGFDVVKHEVREQTPVTVAEAKEAVPVTFDVSTDRTEFTDDGESQDPPDRIRDEVGIEKPRKQSIETPGGRMLVDRVGDLF